MEILLAIALGALLRDPVVTYVDPSYKPSKAEKDSHEKAVRTVASGRHEKVRKVGAAAGRGAAATTAFFAGLGRGAADRWKSRKRPEPKPKPKPPADSTDEPRPTPEPARGEVPDTFRPAPQVILVPMPPSAPPIVPKPEGEQPVPPRPEHPPTIPEQAAPPDEPKPKLQLVKDDQAADEPKPSETKTPEKDVAESGDAPPSGTEPRSPAQEGRTPVASEVHFNQLVGFLLESTTRTRDDAGIARFVHEDDMRIANALDNIANQARDLKAGEKVAAAVTALQEKVAQQAATAREYSDRCNNVAEKAGTADRNIRTRYDGMARSAAEMSEGPAYSSYYQGA